MPSGSGGASGSATPRSTQQPVFVTPTKPPTPTPTNNPSARLYIALGDSLSYGNGASDRNVTAWVPLVWKHLGSGWGLSDLGVPGYTSADLLNKGEIADAIGEINARRDDGTPGNEVGAITLEIGGNDLLVLYEDLVLTGKCPSVPEALQKQECVDGLHNALTNFTPNLEEAVDELKQAAPGVPIFLGTLYNPFSGGSVNLDQIGALALEGQDGTPFTTGLNDAVRAVAQEKGVYVVEWYDLFIGKYNQYISRDLIHPNDEGQKVMAQAVIDAMALAGVQ
jgi:lysophospholipase L1-like esterase